MFNRYDETTVCDRQTNRNGHGPWHTHGDRGLRVKIVHAGSFGSINRHHRLKWKGMVT